MSLFEIFSGVILFGLIIFQMWYLFFSDLSRKNKYKIGLDKDDV